MGAPEVVVPVAVQEAASQNRVVTNHIIREAQPTGNIAARNSLN